MTANINYAFNEFVDLSFSKVKELVLKNGFQIYESFADGYYVAGVDVVKGNAEQCNTPVLNPLDPGSESFVPYDWQRFACPMPWSDDMAMRGISDTLMGDLPEGMTGTLFTDGSNMLLLAKYPGSDRIAYSKSWYNTLDTSAGFKIGMTIVKGILGMVSGGLAPLAIAAFDATNPSPIIRPVDLTPPDSARDDLTPIDALPSDIVVPTPTTIPGEVVDEALPEPAESVKRSLWPLALVALALFS